MYLELLITAEYGNKQALIAKLVQEIGVNVVTAHAAVQQSVFRVSAGSIIPRIVAAEQLQNNIRIVYFLEGGDTIKVHIEAPTVPETKRQAARVARRTCALFENPTVKTKVKAIIYSTNLQGFDTEIIYGGRVGRWRQFLETFTKQWLTRVTTPAIVFFLAVAFLPATTIAQSATLGLLAAGFTLLIESVLFAAKADEWKWEENRGEY
jgi:hypothetical protein